jgi:hypothetical protein
LNWQVPLNTNGIIINYIISYTKDPKEHKTHWSTKVLNGSTSRTDIMDLSPDTTYYLQLQASTSAGLSEPTDLLKMETGSMAGPHTAGNSEGTGGWFSGLMANERNLGIILGVCIGGGCLIICAVIILLRNRICPPRLAPPISEHGATFNGNGYLPNHSNGNGNGNITQYSLNQSNESGDLNYHEMDSFTPLTQLHENEECDTKGGIGYVPNKGKNGKVNGLNGLNGLHGTNGIVRPSPNGKLLHGNGGELGPQVPLRSESLEQQQPPQQLGGDGVAAERECLLPPPSPIHQASSSSLEELDTSGSTGQPLPLTSLSSSSPSQATLVAASGLHPPSSTPHVEYSSADQTDPPSHTNTSVV